MNDFFEIRACKPDDDFLAISKLYLKVWKDAYSDLLPRKTLAHLNEELWQPQKRWENTFLAKANGQEIIGVCTFGPSRSSMFLNEGEIYSLYVDPKYQGLGIGTELIKTALNQLLDKKYYSAFLWVIYNNESAKKFYEKIGFNVLKHQRLDHSKIGDIKEIPMKKILCH